MIARALLVAFRPGPSWMAISLHDIAAFQRKGRYSMPFRMPTMVAS